MHTIYTLDHTPNLPTASGKETVNGRGGFVKTILHISPRKMLNQTPSAGQVSPLTTSADPTNPPDDLSLRFGEHGDHIVVQAPRKGKLGLVIHCIDNLGPIVSQVKDYSPLLGQVLPGDRILDIDGNSTAGMTIKDVTGIMGGKIAHNRWVSVFRIVVWRPSMGPAKEELLELLDANPESSALFLSDSPAPNSGPESGGRVLIE